VAKTKDEQNIYGEVDSAEDIHKISREIREDMDGVRSHDQLTELKKRGDYLCTLAEAPSWEETFGDKIGAIRRAAKEEDRTTTNHANEVARKHGWDADYHAWGSGR
jgi:hypothetical protein